MSDTTAQRDILDRQWFLFSVKPQREDHARKSLEALGFIAPMPMVPVIGRTHRHRKSKQVIKTVPAIRSFVMVGFKSGPVPFRTVLDQPYITGVVGLSSYASRIRGPHVLEFLRSPFIDKASIEKLFSGFDVAERPKYQTGDTVCLMGAGMTGVKGEVSKIHAGRAFVIVPFLGGEREINVPVDAAVKAA